MVYRAKRTGAATVLSLMFLAIVFSLAVASITTAQKDLLGSSNMAQIQSARLQAESGLAFLMYQVRQIPVGRLRSDAVLESFAAALGDRLDGSANLGGASIAYDGSTITIPAIATGEGRSFQATITPVDAQTVQVRVTGRDGTVSRGLGVRLGLSGARSAAFDYGVAARGPIRMTGNAKLLGANSAEEAKMLSATYTEEDAFDLTGNCTIQGDIYASSPDALAQLTGNISIGGQTLTGHKTLPDPDDTDPICEHVHVGVGDVSFPEVDPSVFEPFATSIVDAGTSTSGNKTFTNIRIKANTNKTFSGNLVFNGVIFIEKPNKIHFSGNVVITGVIVTEDAGEGVYADNTLKFTGNVTARGVEDLPDTPEFSALRQLPGSFILAPGFSTEFTGNFGTVNGCMAADKFKWTGNAGGQVKGGIISYSDDEFKLTGNSTITINRAGAPQTPAGFGGVWVLLAQPDSYVEY